jgi:hypothetical protein
MAQKRYGSLVAGQRVLLARSGGRDESQIDTVSEVWRCNFADLYSFLPAKDDPYPSNSNLLCKSSTWRGLGCDLVEFTVTYSGYVAGAGSVSTSRPVYRLGYMQRTEPLNNHPNFETTASGFSTNIRAAIGTTPYADSFDATGFFVAIAQSAKNASSTDAKNLVGVSEYYDFGLAWQQVKLEQGTPSLTDLNRIFTTAQLPGSPPAVPAGRNWLLAQVEGEQEGNVWRNSRTWILSGRNGWNPLVYLES